MEYASNEIYLEISSTVSTNLLEWPNLVTVISLIYEPRMFSTIETHVFRDKVILSFTLFFHFNALIVLMECYEMFLEAIY